MTGLKVTRIASDGQELPAALSIDATYTGDDADWTSSPLGGSPDLWKQPVRAATTADITIATALNAGDTLDGVTLAAGDRVLVKNQSTAAQNGIYVVAATPARAADMDDDDEVLGALVYVIAGTANTATAWKVTNTAATVVDTDAINWAAFGAGSGTAATTVEDETTWGITPAVGTDTEYARQDHTHGSPALLDLNDLGDVDTTGVADNDVLAYDSGTSTWGPAAAGGSGSVATDAIWDAKGDIAGGTGANTAARLAVGTDGHVLTADSGETTGMKWAAVAASGGGYALDSYTLDATYGDDFTAASLGTALWTRRGITSGAETYQVGKEATYLRIAQTGLTRGDGYYQSAASGDWTVACAAVSRYIGDPIGWGLSVVDSAGSGLDVMVYNASRRLYLLPTTTYSTYGGGGVAGSIDFLVSHPWVSHEKAWFYLRKSGTSYYASYSFDGEAWGPEVGPASWAGTVDRWGLVYTCLGNAGAAGSYIDIDWFNKIA